MNSSVKKHSKSNFCLTTKNAPGYSVVLPHLPKSVLTLNFFSSYSKANEHKKQAGKMSIFDEDKARKASNTVFKIHEKCLLKFREQNETILLIFE